MSSEAALESDTSHVPVSDDDPLPFIHPTNPTTLKPSTESQQPITDLPLFKEMEDLRKQFHVKENPEEVDAILSGTLLDRNDEGLSQEQIKTVRNKLKELKKMPMKDLLEYVQLCTFN